MSGVLFLEIQDRNGWHPVGQLTLADADGSVSQNTPQGREVIRFGCRGSHSVIERSVGGADVELGPLRSIHTLGFEEIARLGPGEKVEMWLRTDRMAVAAHFRFRHEEAT